MTLPVSVIIPTWNVGAAIEGHVCDLNRWIASVQEVIVVDSESNDGTVEYLQEHLRHTCIQWLTRPRGLYAAWNAGIAASRGKYVIFATVGDTIYPQAVENLYSVAEKTAADVVLSPPRIIQKGGAVVPLADWPIHRMLRAHSGHDSFMLNASQAFALANAFGIQGLLGSSASNLYRTEALKRWPFPTEYGHAGDTAWGCRNALRARVAVWPEICADFIQEREGGMLADAECSSLELRFLELAKTALLEATEQGTIEYHEQLALEILCQGWRRSRQWMHEQVLHAEHISQVSSERMAYITDLQNDGQSRLDVIQTLSKEIERLQAALEESEKNRKSPQSPGANLLRRLKSKF